MYWCEIYYKKCCYVKSKTKTLKQNIVQNMYIYIFIQVCVYICIYTSVCVCVCIYMLGDHTDESDRHSHLKELVCKC